MDSAKSKDSCCYQTRWSIQLSLLFGYTNEQFAEMQRNDTGSRLVFETNEAGRVDRYMGYLASAVSIPRDCVLLVGQLLQKKVTCLTFCNCIRILTRHIEISDHSLMEICSQAILDASVLAYQVQVIVFMKQESKFKREIIASIDFYLNGSATGRNHFFQFLQTLDRSISPDRKELSKFLFINHEVAYDHCPPIEI